MTGAVYLTGFKDDTWLNGIGDLFCKKDSLRWGVNLSIYPGKENGSNSTSLSNAPLLIRKNIINPTKDYYQNSHEQSFQITTTRDWDVVRLKSCPALERRLTKELQQYCFEFSIAEGIRFFLPQFELARALFFHNAYLARSSVLHDVLSNEFITDIEPNRNCAHVQVLDTCNCPTELFSDYGFRRHLAWLLLDEEVRSSYQSISRHQLRNGIDNGIYRRWTFQFDPPQLHGVVLNVRGRFEPISRSFLVYEVLSIRKIASNIPNVVEFTSPKFKTSVGGKGTGTGGGSGQPNLHNVDDESEESNENKPVMLKASKVEFEYAQAVETRKVSKKTKPTGGRKNDDAEPTDAPTDVSSEEQGPLGGLPSAEWDTLDEQTDDTHLYLSKFSSYFEMLRLLEEKYGCTVIKYPLRKLPAIGKCKMHILKTDGNPRCMSVAHVKVADAYYYLLEVDTSDASKALSTKVISASAKSQIAEYLTEIERHLLKSSLSWPVEVLDRLFGKGTHSWVAHQMSRKGGALNEDEISKWAARTYAHLGPKLKSNLPT